MKNRFITILIALFLSLFAKAQEVQPQMADDMRADGKIFVVISVIAIVFVCLLAYLIYIDVKLKQIEKKN